MNKNYLFSTILFLNVSVIKAQTIMVTGHVIGLPSGKVYLTEAYTAKVLDSANYDGSNFIFNYKCENNFEPFLASIKYFDNDKRRSLFVRNYILDGKYGSDGFMLEPGSIVISGVNNPKANLNIIAGQETDAMFYTQMMDFGFIRGSTSVTRSQKISTYTNAITTYPFSYYLLYWIHQYRTDYTKSELKDIIKLFNGDVCNSKLMTGIKNYLADGADPGQPLAPMNFYNADHIKKAIDYSGHKLTMLIFWASWCGPCRAEIPGLKQLNNSNAAKNIQIVSISLDLDLNKWQQAVNTEKMPWPQLITGAADHDELKNKYTFSAIPTILFINNRGVEVKRITGSGNAGLKEMRTFLDENL